MEDKSIKRELFEKLRLLYNEKDFVYGVMSNVHNDEDRKHIIDYLNDSDNVSVEQTILLSLKLTQRRKNNEKAHKEKYNGEG